MRSRLSKLLAVVSSSPGWTASPVEELSLTSSAAGVVRQSANYNGSCCCRSCEFRCIERWQYRKQAKILQITCVNRCKKMQKKNTTNQHRINIEDVVLVHIIFTNENTKSAILIILKYISRSFQKLLLFLCSIRFDFYNAGGLVPHLRQWRRPWISLRCRGTTSRGCCSRCVRTWADIMRGTLVYLYSRGVPACI